MIVSTSAYGSRLYFYVCLQYHSETYYTSLRLLLKQVAYSRWLTFETWLVEFYGTEVLTKFFLKVRCMVEATFRQQCRSKSIIGGGLRCPSASSYYSSVCAISMSV